MSDDKNVKVDPRFDPAFQRGFDQSIPIEESVPPPAPRTATTDLASVIAPSEPESPLKIVATPAVVSAPAPIVDDDESLSLEEALTETDVSADLESSPTRNPFLLLLCVVAIALVAVGVWLFVRSGDAFNSSAVLSQGDYMSLDATIHMAPFIALLGAATAIGVLFVFAARWRKRR